MSETAETVYSSTAYQLLLWSLVSFFLIWDNHSKQNYKILLKNKMDC